MKKLIGTMAAIAVAFSASAAFAGVYVTGPLPSEFTGGSIPTDPDLMKAMGKSSKEGSKLAAGVAKCFSKGAKNVSKGNPSGVDTCIHSTKKGVLVKYEAKVAGITPDAPCALVGAGQTVLAITKTFNANIYCQSPSGAFIDQASF